MGGAGGGEGVGGGTDPVAAGPSRMAGTANSHSPKRRNTARLAKSR